MVPAGVVSRGNSVLFIGPRIISLVLVVFNSMSFFIDQVRTLLKKAIILDWYDLDWKVSDRVVSSAVRSSMSTRNDKGPNQEPCDIPPISGRQAESVTVALTVDAGSKTSDDVSHCLRRYRRRFAFKFGFQARCHINGRRRRVL